MIVFIVTFSLFFMEALLHYNYGKDDEKSKFHIPDNKVLFQIIITVAFFSLLNSYILRYLAKYYHIH